MYQYEFVFDGVQTLMLAIILLIIGRGIKKKVNLLEKFFIPAPVIGGSIFSILLLIGHSTQLFGMEFNSSIKDFLMIAFFTSIGFSASLGLLKKGGIGVLLFLVVATLLVVVQDVVGVSLAGAFGLHPYIGLAAGSIPLTGGHGTSGAFGPVLEAAGCSGATVVAIASATYGLVAGCLIGGPLAKRLLNKYNLKPTVMSEKKEINLLNKNNDEVTEETLFRSIIFIIISVVIGDLLNPVLKNSGITLPVYITSMFIAAIIRNIVDRSSMEMPIKSINVLGNISLSLFLSIALMSMKLWQLSDLAIPLIVILLIQTLIMWLFAYYVTFNVMGRDYDAAVIACGHCGFGLGATPNAMANMETFTAANGPSTKAFFVLPLVGALFIDFTNASIITLFMNFFK